MMLSSVWTFTGGNFLDMSVCSLASPCYQQYCISSWDRQSYGKADLYQSCRVNGMHTNDDTQSTDQSVNVGGCLVHSVEPQNRLSFTKYWLNLLCFFSACSQPCYTIQVLFSFSFFCWRLYKTKINILTKCKTSEIGRASCRERV